ncbi:hypothetical protein CDSM653_00690 [Caldanaerobacter subterraneus subsp. pacificus DSM 12653]|uniref:Uncharacterized protein n=1 Tax=Caldanaerobacter subterraneus subsp. pacificus DSM 12653 TaxID=391606 RepID=A0A0F5PNH9_9THEO|nr:hypothetical protein CDSM653_00690 [Caldanaerobacter subterraneus subsp. pacificus DSM 12653]
MLRGNGNCLIKNVEATVTTCSSSKERIKENTISP